MVRSCRSQRLSLLDGRARKTTYLVLGQEFPELREVDRGRPGQPCGPRVLCKKIIDNLAQQLMGY